MGIYDEQIKKRDYLDKQRETLAELSLRNAIAGKKNKTFDACDEDVVGMRALTAILHHMNITAPDFPRTTNSLTTRLEYLMETGLIGFHSLRLQKKTLNCASVPMIVKDNDEQWHALVPGGFKGYCEIELSNGKKMPLSASLHNAKDLQAYEIFTAFPLTPLTENAVLSWLFHTMCGADALRVFFLSLLYSTVGAVTPIAIYKLFADVLQKNEMRLGIAICSFLFAVLIMQTLFKWMKDSILIQIHVRLSYAWRSALMMRILSMPTQFFRRYATNTILSQIVKGGCIPEYIMEVTLENTLFAIGSLFTLIPILFYAPHLAATGFTLIISVLLLATITFIVRVRLYKKIQVSELQDESRMTELLRGIQKIKLAGAEKRAFTHWSKSFAKSLSLKYAASTYARLEWSPPTIMLALALPLAFFAAYCTATSNAALMAYSAALGVLSLNLMQLINSGRRAELIAPFLLMLKPLLEEYPEMNEASINVANITGQITLENVSFRYDNQIDWVIDKLNLKIKTGEFVAITGKSECGKSTILRILLGFEKPQSGAVYYNNLPLAKLNLRSLRKKLGVVMQNSNLFPGSIFDNIALTKPDLTKEQAWEAVHIAQMEDDIKKMPMGMETLVQEAGGGISGGQKQRLLLARAIASKPKVLFLDEATSALDNITQKKVMEGLATLKCTRIVVAHRLSTVQHCDRIIVMDNGKIAEEGNYEELIAKNGIFAELVKKQRIDT